MEDDDMPAPRKIVYWEIEGRENLRYTTIDAAVEAVIDELSPIPESIEICGFARRVVSQPHYFLEDLVNALDEEYGGEDATDITLPMEDAAEIFWKVIVQEYFPWNCEIVERRTINIREWSEKNYDT